MPAKRTASHSRVQSVTIESIDRAVNDWLDRTVDVHVRSPGGDLKKVPVLFSAGERAATSRSSPRDKNGVLILPVIQLSRKSIVTDPSMSALGCEQPRLNFSRRISPKTNDIRSLDAARAPSTRTPSSAVVYEVASIPYPDRSITNYEIKIRSQYVTQMNAIVEKILHNTNFVKSFVAPLDNDGYVPQVGVPFEERVPISVPYVVGFLDDGMTSQDNFDEYTDNERIVVYTINVRVPTVLQLDPEGTQPAIQYERTAFGLSFGDENVVSVDDQEELEKIFGK